jgi:acetoin utilization deacetylase AcuC-like enzyme
MTVKMNMPEKVTMSEKQLYIAYDPIYAHPLPEGHRFPMLKYELIPEQLLYEGVISADNLFRPAACAEDVLLLTHTREYLDKLLHQTLSAREQRHIGFTQSPMLTRRELVITQGTIDCCLYAMANGVALNVAGGTHHAFADRGEGFCLLNDFAVAANYLLQRQIADRLLIIDLDVHQGNGTASLFEREPRVYTFSMHGRHNYPFHKETSDWDIPLEDGTDDDTYLSALGAALPILLERVKPQLVFYLSGVDILVTDQFGKLKITPEGCRRRDEMVFTALKERDIACVTAMGGGYSKDIRVIVDAHCQTFRKAKEIYGL